MWKISYLNLMMLFATIPRYKGEEKKKEEVKEVDDLSGVDGFVTVKN